MFRFSGFTNVVVANSFLACFWVWRSGQTTVSHGKSFLWVFLFGLLPLSCVWFAVSLDETQVWLGDLRVVWLGCVFFGLSCFACTSGPFGSLYNDIFTAYAHVRTEPQCDIGYTRGKKKITLYHLDMVWQQKQREEHQKHKAIPEGERSKKSTMRKPGIPAARIPEITWRKPSRHNSSHIVTSKQTKTNSCRNESGEKKGETDSETWANVRNDEGAPTAHRARSESAQFFVFLLGQLAGLRTGPLPVLLWLSTTALHDNYNSSFCCDWTCVTTWRKPWRRWTEKKKLRVRSVALFQSSYSWIIA